MELGSYLQNVFNILEVMSVCLFVCVPMSVSVSVCVYNRVYLKEGKGVNKTGKLL
jgi:hypothetical protein